MAATDAASVRAASARPYAPSWLDVVFDGIAGLPGPTWVAYLVLIIPSILLTNSALWISGLRPWGEMDATQAFWGTLTVGIFAATHYLRHVAGAAFDAFRPALGFGVSDPERARSGRPGLRRSVPSIWRTPTGGSCR